MIKRAFYIALLLFGGIFIFASHLKADGDGDHLILNNRDISADEPSYMIVWELSFSGNKTFPPIVLKEVIASISVPAWSKLNPWGNYSEYRFSEREIMRDAIRIERFYQRRGFPEAKVTYTVKNDEKWWQQKVHFTVEEGKSIRIKERTIHFQNEVEATALREDDKFQQRLNKIPFRTGKRYEPVRSSEVEGTLVRYLKNAGYAFADVSTSAKVDTAQRTASITITIDSGPLGSLSGLNVDGNRTVSDDLVLKEAALDSGMIYSQNLIGKAQQELFNHHLYRFVTITVPEQKRDSTVDLTISIKENEPRVLRLRGGTGTEELARTEASWTHLNPFGNTHSLTFSGRLALNWNTRVRQARLGTAYLIPYLFNTKSSFQVSPFVNYQNEPGYQLNQIGINNSFVYQYSRQLNSSISYEYTINEIGEKSEQSISRDSLKLYNISSIKLASYYRDGFFSRNTNWIVSPSIEFSGFLGTGTFEYQKYYLEVRRFIQTSESSQLAFKINTGYINASENDSLPASVRLYSGGTSSVRGWARNQLGPQRVRNDDNGDFSRYVSTGGRFAFAATVEIRKQVNWPFKGIGFAIFGDAGQVWQDITDIRFLPETYYGTIDGQNTNGLQFGLGGGIGYESPIGQIRLDIAYKLNPTEADLEIFEGTDYGNPLSRWGIHFSIGNPF